MAIPIELSTEPLQEPAASRGTAISCLARLSVQNGGAARIEATRGSIDLAGETLPLSRLVELAAEFGLQAEPIELDWQGLKTAVFARPLLIVRKNTDVAVVAGGGRSGAEEVSVWDPHHDGVVFFVSREDFERTWSGHALIITPGANNLKLPSGGEAASDTANDTSPAPPDIPKQQTPPNPMRAARTARLSHDAGTPRRSLGLRLCLAATAIVAAATIALFSITYPGADHVAGPSTAAEVVSAGAQSTLVNQREPARSAGVVATAPVLSTPEAVSTSATPTSAEPAGRPTPSDAMPPVAPTREANLAAAPAVAAPSTEATPAAPSAQMPEARLSVATPGPPAPPAGPVLSAPEIAALVARGDALFSKGDLAAARLFYERAANAGDGQAAVRLGETFDPVFLDHAHLPGVRGDFSTALSWYRRARDLGAADADILIKSLEAQ